MGNAIWLYWEGELAPYLRLCLRTITRHNADVRVLDRTAFEELRAEDRDLDLDRLSAVQRSDYARAYLLRAFGGLYLDVDCVVLRPLTPILDLAREAGFVGYRQVDGDITCNLIASVPGGAVIERHYATIVRKLRDGRPLEWLDLTAASMNGAVRRHRAAARLLPTETVMPLPWWENEALADRGPDDVHETRFAADAWCYMLSNNTIRGRERSAELAVLDEHELLAGDWFLSFLLRRALLAADA